MGGVYWGWDVLFSDSCRGVREWWMRGVFRFLWFRHTRAQGRVGCEGIAEVCGGGVYR